MQRLFNWKFISFVLFIASLLFVVFVKCCTLTFQLNVEDNKVVNGYKVYYIQNLINKHLSEKQSGLFIGSNNDKRLVIKAGLINYLTKYRFDLPEERGVYKITKFLKFYTFETKTLVVQGF